jgi:hypothetical protein
MLGESLDGLEEPEGELWLIVTEIILALVMGIEEFIFPYSMQGHILLFAGHSDALFEGRLTNFVELLGPKHFYIFENGFNFRRFLAGYSILDFQIWL